MGKLKNKNKTSQSIYPDTVITEKELNDLRVGYAARQQEKLLNRYEVMMADDDVSLVLDDDLSFSAFLAQNPTDSDEFDQAYVDAIFLDSLSKDEKLFFDECIAMPVEKLKTRLDRFTQILDSMKECITDQAALRTAERKQRIVRISYEDVISANNAGKSVVNAVNSRRNKQGLPSYHVDRTAKGGWPLATESWHDRTLPILYERLQYRRYIDQRLTLKQFERAWYKNEVRIEWLKSKTELAIFIKSFNPAEKRLNKWLIIRNVFFSNKFDMKDLAQSAKKSSSKKHWQYFGKLWKAALIS